MIIGVAVKEGDLMICLPKPNRHHHCIMYAVTVLGLIPPIGAAEGAQGFYTAQGEFLNRTEALAHAIKHDQLISIKAKHELFSEDLW